VAAADEILKQAKVCDAVAIGPGISRNPETIQLVWELFLKIEKPLVVDADAIYALSEGFKLIKGLKDKKDITEILGKRTYPTIITPHAGEALHLLKSINFKSKKITSKYIDENKKEIAKALADKLKFIVALKGHDTVIAEPEERIVINKTGGPGLATAGTGDVLCGMITSFVAQNPKKIFEAVATAVYLHGLAGDIASQKIGERAMIASDVIKYLPAAIRQAEGEIDK